MTTAFINSIPAAKRKASANYLALVKRFPLRPIETLADYDAASQVMEKLAIRDEHTLSPGELDYLEVLSGLIERYDEKHFPLDLKVSPLDALVAAMELRELSASDLAKVIGSQSATSMILNGKRTISKGQAKKLAAFFRVDAGLFI
jgi:HTH-type transcriptional regulator/antitoxin HigA